MIVNMIIQARMGSTRCPGKVMRDIGGKPMIGYLLDRMEQCKEVDRIIVAIPDEDVNSLLFEYLKKRPIALVAPRGVATDDVYGRFATCLKVWQCDAFVRVCADSPMFSSDLIDWAVVRFKDRRGHYLLAQDDFGSVEVCDTGAFLSLPAFFHEEREHVTTRLRNGRFIIDTEEDFGRVAKMVMERCAPV